MRTSSSGKLKKVYFLKFHLIDELSSLAMTEEACFRGSHHIILAFQPNGDGEIRTLDPLLARQVLSQLSYTPIKAGNLLLSRAVSSEVSSADQVLTIVFGMCTGVTPDRIITSKYLVILNN